ncbi:MAG: DUF917 domain-containing protein [Bacillota bacterium]|nr:MAG: DUF917 domain-containing protein [Bacillota bacterium]
MTITVIDATALEDLALGATMLGTGGGGDPYIGKLMAQEAIQRYGAVRLVDLADLPRTGLVLPVAMMGAPTVLVEKIPNGRELERVVRAVESHLGKPVVALMSAEAGGINSTIPVVAAAELRLPLLDADGMGRAFPEIPMCSMNLAGVSATPMAVVDEKGNLVLLETIDNQWTERLSRTATVAMGGSSIIALYPMTTDEVHRAVIPGTLRRAIAIGRAIRGALARGNPIDALLRVTGGTILFRGKVVDVVRRTEGGFVRGTATLEGLERDRGSVLRLEFQNENLVALKDGVPVAMVPDLITILDSETYTPITTEGIAYGQRVAVLGMPCAPIWRSPRGLVVAGPRYFGYPFDYVPIEEAAPHALPARD